MDDKELAQKARQVVEFLGANGVSEMKVQAALMDALTSEHRTLQQSFWRNIRQVIYGYADLQDAYYIDDRNRASKEWCKAVLGESDTKPNFIGLPLI